MCIWVGLFVFLFFFNPPKTIVLLFKVNTSLITSSCLCANRGLSFLSAPSCNYKHLHTVLLTLKFFFIIIQSFHQMMDRIKRLLNAASLGTLALHMHTNLASSELWKHLLVLKPSFQVSCSAGLRWTLMGSLYKSLWHLQNPKWRLGALRGF